MNWWAKIQEWRKTSPLRLSATVVSMLTEELKLLRPGQMHIVRTPDKREYVILELADLEALLKRAGMVMRNPK